MKKLFFDWPHRCQRWGVPTLLGRKHSRLERFRRRRKERGIGGGVRWVVFLVLEHGQEQRFFLDVTRRWHNLFSTILAARVRLAYIDGGGVSVGVHSRIARTVFRVIVEDPAVEWTPVILMTQRATRLRDRLNRRRVRQGHRCAVACCNQQSQTRNDATDFQNPTFLHCALLLSVTFHLDH